MLGNERLHVKEHLNFCLSISSNIKNTTIPNTKQNYITVDTRVLAEVFFVFFWTIF